MSDFKGWLTADISLNPWVDGKPAINEIIILDVIDYFKTEDNKHFLVTEAGEHLGFY